MSRKPSIEVYLENEEEKVVVKKAAAEARMSISNYSRTMMLKGVVKRPFSDDELKMISSLAGMANNLNQAVKRMHQDKESIAVIKEVEEIIKRIGAILDDSKDKNR